MENIHFGQFGTFGNAATESAKNLETINGKLIGQLTQKNMELFNSAIEMNNKFVSLLGDTKDVQTLLTEQAQLTTEYAGKVITTMQAAAAIVVGSKDDYQAWFEASLKSANDMGLGFTAAPAAQKKKAA